MAGILDLPGLDKGGGGIGQGDEGGEREDCDMEMVALEGGCASPSRCVDHPRATA